MWFGTTEWNVRGRSHIAYLERACSLFQMETRGMHAQIWSGSTRLVTWAHKRVEIGKGTNAPCVFNTLLVAICERPLKQLKSLLLVLQNNTKNSFENSGQNVLDPINICI